MHYEWILILPVILVASCASPQRVARNVPLSSTQTASPPPPAFPVSMPMRLVESRYTVRSYRESTAPDIRHEAHVVFRQTRVPVGVSTNLDTIPRETFPSASIAPLSNDDELTAELNTQKEITEELRNVKKAMSGMEAEMQARYAALVKQSGEVMALREQLEAENARVRALKQTQINAPAAAPPVAENTDVRW